MCRYASIEGFLTSFSLCSSILPLEASVLRLYNGPNLSEQR